MGSHSVTCHPAEVTFPPLPQPKLVLDLATLGGCKAKLLCTTTTGPTHILWSELSWRKLSPTLATAHYSCPDNAIGPAAECELIGYVKLRGAVWRQLADIFTQTQEPCHS